MTGAGVLCVGRVYCDLVFSGLQHMPKPGEEIYANGLSFHTGGGAAITAHALAALGRSVSLCASLPAAPFSSIVEKTLKPTVDIQHCTVPDTSDPQITVVLTGQFDRSFVTRRPEQALPANLTVAFEAYTAAGITKHLHIGELATLVDYPELIPLARAAHWTISLDCAWDEDAIFNKKAGKLIESVDVFLPNESEMQTLKRTGIDEDCAPLTIVKRAEHGAQAFHQKEIIDSAAEHTTCVDTTGAGDSFNAGFLDAWLRSDLLTDCLKSGNRCGANAVTHPGGIPA